MSNIKTKNLQWSGDRPKCPGNYLVNVGSAILLLPVAYLDGALVTEDGVESRPVSDYSRHCQWMGPITCIDTDEADVSV